MLHYTRGIFVAFVGLFGAGTICHAAIVYSPVINLAIPVNAPGLYLNIQTGASGTSAASVPGWDINVGGTSSLNFASPGGYNFVRLNSASPTAGPSNLTNGFNISASMPTASWIAGGAASGPPGQRSAAWLTEVQRVLPGADATVAIAGTAAQHQLAIGLQHGHTATDVILGEDIIVMPPDEIGALRAIHQELMVAGVADVDLLPKHP